MVEAVEIKRNAGHEDAIVIKLVVGFERWMPGHNV
jgi:hypothetical protein